MEQSTLLYIMAIESKGLVYFTRAGECFYEYPGTYFLYSLFEYTLIDNSFSYSYLNLMHAFVLVNKITMVSINISAQFKNKIIMTILVIIRAMTDKRTDKQTEKTS